MIKSNFTPQKGFPLYVEDPRVVNNTIKVELAKYRKSLRKKINKRGATL